MDDNDLFPFLEKLRVHFPNINGLEDPILITHASDGIEKTSDFVRIMLANDYNHWVTVRGNAGVLEIYDSLPRNQIDCILLKNISNVLPNNLKVNKSCKALIKNVQFQKDQNCGYFALAFATALCMGLDPEDIVFDEDKIREHFFEIIYHGKLFSMFPYQKTERKKHEKMITFECL